MARRFDNSVSNYLNRSSVNLSLNGGTAFSLAYWINITSGEITGRIIHKEINAQDGWNSFQSQIVGANVINFEVSNQSLNQAPDWKNSSALAAGWNHIVFAWQRSAGAVQGDCVMYVNGVSVTTTFAAFGYTNAFTIQEDSSNLLIGIRPITITDPLDAKLEEVQIYNKQLSSGEVTNLYSFGTVASGIIGQWNITGNENLESDSSGSGNHLSITGTLLKTTGHQGKTLVPGRLRPRAFAPGLAR